MQFLSGPTRWFFTSFYLRAPWHLLNKIIKPVRKNKETLFRVEPDAVRQNYTTNMMIILPDILQKLYAFLISERRRSSLTLTLFRLCSATPTALSWCRLLTNTVTWARSSLGRLNPGIVSRVRLLQSIQIDKKLRSIRYFERNEERYKFQCSEYLVRSYR